MKKIEFNQHRGDLHKLCEYIEKRGSVVEVGSLAGVSTEIFSKYFNNVFSIDPYIAGYDENDINSKSSKLEAAKKIFNEKFKNNNAVKQYNITSQEASRKFSGEIFDLVYLDACHSHEEVTRDIGFWSNKCRYISGHDWDWCAVRSAVAESLGEDNVKIFKPNHWIVKL